MVQLPHPFFGFIFSFCCLFRATPMVYGSSQASGLMRAPPAAYSQLQQLWIRALSATYTTAHGNARSLTHWGRLGIEPASSRIVVGFLLLYHDGNSSSTFRKFALCHLAFMKDLPVWLSKRHLKRVIAFMKKRRKGKIVFSVCSAGDFTEAATPRTAGVTRQAPWQKCTQSLDFSAFSRHRCEQPL